MSEEKTVAVTQAQMEEVYRTAFLKGYRAGLQDTVDGVKARLALTDTELVAL